MTLVLHWTKIVFQLFVQSQPKLCSCLHIFTVTITTYCRFQGKMLMALMCECVYLWRQRNMLLFCCVIYFGTLYFGLFLFLLISGGATCECKLSYTGWTDNESRWQKRTYCSQTNVCSCWCCTTTIRSTPIIFFLAFHLCSQIHTHLWCFQTSEWCTCCPSLSLWSWRVWPSLPP